MKQEIIRLLERAKEDGRTIGDVLAEVRGIVEPVAAQAPTGNTTIPAGWRLAPIEPTHAMVIEGLNAGLEHKDEPYFIYAAMLNAAPAPPAPASSAESVAVVVGSDLKLGRESRGLRWADGVDPFSITPGTALCAAPVAAQAPHRPQVTVDMVNRAKSVLARAGGASFALNVRDALEAALDVAQLQGKFAAQAPAAAGGAQMLAAPEWMTCDKRGWMVTESLTRNAKQMRTDEKRCRTAYQQEYMGAPTRWLADVYAEAATVFERKLVELAAQRKGDA